MLQAMQSAHFFVPSVKRNKSKRSEPEDNQVRHLLLCFVRSHWLKFKNA
jgi:hypothetical protein